MKYALLIHTNDESWSERSEQEQQAIMGEYMAIAEPPGVFGGAQLQPVDGRDDGPRADGRTLTTDGPFAETKEVLGGFYLFEAPTTSTTRSTSRRGSRRRGWAAPSRFARSWSADHSSRSSATSGGASSPP